MTGVFMRHTSIVEYNGFDFDCVKPKIIKLVHVFVASPWTCSIRELE